MTRCLNCRKSNVQVTAEYREFLEKEHGLTAGRDKLELLTEDYEYAVSALDGYFMEHLEIIEEYFKAVERIAHCKKEIEDEAKERARQGQRVALDTEHFRFFIRKSAKRVVDPAIVTALSDDCYKLGEEFPDLFNVSLKKLDELSEQGDLAKYHIEDYITEGEPTYAFHLEKKDK